MTLLGPNPWIIHLTGAAFMSNYWEQGMPVRIHSSYSIPSLTWPLEKTQQTPCQRPWTTNVAYLIVVGVADVMWNPQGPRLLNDAVSQMLVCDRCIPSPLLSHHKGSPVALAHGFLQLGWVIVARWWKKDVIFRSFLSFPSMMQTEVLAWPSQAVEGWIKWKPHPTCHWKL